MTLRHALLGTSAAALLAAGTASAQVGNDASEVTDEIIVTATKRAQTLQEIPIAVTVTPAEVIERAQILDIADLQSVVPTLRVDQNQNSQQTTFSIRGFGNGGNSIGIEPSVGVFVDGVFRSRAAAQIGDLPNLERVEVLNGPQSTLFGKNSSAGVISIVTAEPSFEPEGYIEAGLANFDGYNGRAYISGGLSDSVAASIGGSFTQRDGYADAFLEGLEDVNDRDRWNVRGQLLWEASEDVTFRVIGDYSEIDEICCTATNIVNGPTAGIIQLLGGQLANPEDPFALVDFSDTNAINEIDDYGFSLHIDAAITDDIEFVSISSYRKNDAFFDSEADFTTASLVESVSNGNEIDTWTQEIRLLGSTDRFDWLVGGYAFQEEIDGFSALRNGSDQRAYLGALAALGGGAAPGPDIFAAGEATFAGLEQALGIPVGSFYADGSGTREDYDQSNFLFSAFANVDFDVTERLTLTGGISYINDSKDVTFQQTLNTEPFSQLNFAGADGAQILTAQGFQMALPGAFAGTFGIPFTPENVQAVGAANFAAFQAGLLAQVQAGVAGLDLLDPAQNPLLGLAALQFLPIIPGFPNAVESGSTDDDDVTFTLRAAYDLTPDLNVYAAYATGFKPSSFNLTRDSRPAAANFPALAAAGNILPNNTAVTLTNAARADGQLIGPFTGSRLAGPEDAEVYELGVKGRYDWGNFAVTGFIQNIQDFQAVVFQGAGFAVLNAGEQETLGVEVDLNLRPTPDFLDGLTFRITGAYYDADFEEFAGAPGVGGPVDASGTTVDGVAPFRMSLGASYEFDINTRLGGFVRGDWQFESDTDIALNVPGADGTNAIEGLPAFERDISQFNFAAGFGFQNGLSVEGFVRNAFNDDFFSTGFPGVIQNGTFNAYPNQPRTYGVNLRYDF